MRQEARRVVVCLVAAGASSVTLTAYSADEAKASFGVGLRAGGGYTHNTTDPPPSTTPPYDSIGITTLDVRPYISGQVLPTLKFEGNLDLNNGDQGRIHVLDAVAKFEPDELFNFWFGRFLPPSDRANLSGPYYQNAWNYPAVANGGYPSVYAGRADGGAIWGQVDKGRFKYQAGVFTTSATTKTDHAIYAGRLTFNFLDPEPGYYNNSTYYGTKDILALGGAIQFQQHGAGAAPDAKDLLGFNLDLLFEKRLPSGDAVTLEGAYYNFNKGSKGWSFWALASYLFGTKLGFGQIQPMARYSQITPTEGGDPTRIIDGGINYIIDGHNARVALVVQNTNPPGSAPSVTSVQLGVQIQK